MKTCILIAVLASSLLLAPAASAVTFEWVTIGDPGNACDDEPQLECFGAVDHVYRIGKFEVTNAQYAEFLNAKAASDPLELYNTNMADYGGITRSGSDGSYTYSAIPGRENKPIMFVSYFDALRFVNWLHNGQGNGDTETGAYTLLGGTPTPGNTFVERNPGATIFIPTEDEWYKAAYYDTSSGTYFLYPTGTDTQVVCSAPTAAPNTANCGSVAPDFSDVGSYPGSPSPNGTFDQGGNVEEWSDAFVFLDHRPLRAGAAYTPADRLRKLIRNYDDPSYEAYGFRVASIADGAVCGDAACEGEEDPISCPADCPDECGDGLCTGNEGLQSCAADCACVTDADCDDGVFCNGVETCHATLGCQAGAPVDCNDGIDCTGDACNEATDACDYATVDSACDDGLPCNGIETCRAALGCQAGAPIDCDDGVSCTSDSCYNATAMCIHTPVDAVCDNGLFCDGVETCDATLDCRAGVEPCGGVACDEPADACVGGAGAVIWMSFKAGTSVPGVGAVADEDIVAFDVAAGTWALRFDGSDVGLGGHQIDGLAVLAGGDLLLSFAVDGTVSGLIGGPSGNSVDDSDIVRFSPTSLGSTTAGTFTFHFDGSDVSLTSSTEDIDGIALAQNGSLILSTTGGFSANGASGAAADLIVFAATSLGASTAGGFTLLFDGSDVGLASTSENVDAVTRALAGDFLLSTTGGFGVPGVSGNNEDVLEFAPSQLGTSTSGSYSMFLDLSTVGISTGADVGALHIVE